MKLPTKIKVGYRNYEVKPMPKEEADERGLRGSHLNQTGLIKVDESMDSEQQANTFFHEILHACWLQCDLPEEPEEHTVTVLANHLTQVFQDNPEVSKYLRNALAKKPVTE